jgi:predicted RNase H-like nuclease (RuvC/YqgF family)
VRQVTPERALGLRITILVTVIVLFALLLVAWVDYLGVYDVRGRMREAFGIIRERRVEDPGLLREREFEKREAALDLRRKDLDDAAARLSEKEEELTRRSQELERDLAAFEQREKTLIEKRKAAESYDRKVRDLAEKVVAMRPEDAVERLNGLGDDLLIIEILRRVDRNAETEGKMSVVPYYFSLMDRDTASRLMRKMLREE